MNKLLVVGVGLIGGSCALALKRANAVREVVGVGRTRANLDVAIERHVVDRALTLDAPWADEVRDADVVLVAAPSRSFPRCLRPSRPTWVREHA
jgi:prephenate dehydrogenase